MWVFSSRRTIPLLWKWNGFPDIVLKLCTSGALNWSSSALLGFPSLSPSDMSRLFHIIYIMIILHIYKIYFTDMSRLFHKHVRIFSRIYQEQCTVKIFLVTYLRHVRIFHQIKDIYHCPWTIFIKQKQKAEIKFLMRKCRCF